MVFDLTLDYLQLGSSTSRGTIPKFTHRNTTCCAMHMSHRGMCQRSVDMLHEQVGQDLESAEILGLGLRGVRCSTDGPGCPENLHADL